MKGISGKETAVQLVSGEFCNHQGLGEAITLTAKRFPKNVAVSHNNISMTYAELDSSAADMSVELESLGISSGQKIAILMHRSEKMIVALLAILKLGCTYVPIDAESPKNRIDFILEDSDVCAVVIDDFIEYENSLDIPLIKANQRSTVSKDQSFSAKPVKNKDLAYIIYTSGSTGRPKGVQVTHANVHNYAYWFRSEFGMTETNSIDFSSTLAFDLSVTSTIVPLLCGAKIEICPHDIKSLPHKYIDYVRKTGVNFVKLTPSYFGQINTLVNTEHILPDQLTIILGGEALIVKDVKDWLARYSNHRVINEYGPTEATVATIAYTVSANDPYLESSRVPIGLPSFNTEIYLLNELELCEPDEIGELCITGDSVSLGYIDRPELNSEVFIDNPFNHTGKMYRTGDLARVLKDGNIEFLGRKDHQIKIRGFRIEPGEIEAVLLNHKIVDSVVVRPFKNGDEAKLVAYLKICHGKSLGVFELRQYLKKRLPEYMIPSYFMFLDKMPLTVNGKMDLEALPLPGDYATTAENIEPENDIEQTILEIWASVLNSTFGVTDDFFFLGGESINAAQIIYQLERKFSVQISLQAFYKASNVRALAKLIGAQLASVIAEDELLLKALAEIEAIPQS